MPYWDWSADADTGNAAASPVLSDDVGIDGDGSPSGVVTRRPFAYLPNEFINEGPNEEVPFYRPHYLNRTFGSGLARNRTSPLSEDAFNTRATQRVLLNNDDYPLILRLDVVGMGPPSAIHRAFGGDMLLPQSANDPAFFLHHANVDRLWRLWQKGLSLADTRRFGSLRAERARANEDRLYDYAGFAAERTSDPMRDPRASLNDVQSLLGFIFPTSRRTRSWIPPARRCVTHSICSSARDSLQSSRMLERAEDAAAALRAAIGPTTTDLATLPQQSSGANIGLHSHHHDDEEDDDSDDASLDNLDESDMRTSSAKKAKAAATSPHLASISTSLDSSSDKAPSAQPDLALLAVNSFQRDLSHHWPLIRASAIKAVGSLRIPVYSDSPSSPQHATPTHTYAASQPSKAYALDTSALSELVSLLTLLFNDRSPSVLGAALVACASLGYSPPETAAVSAGTSAHNYDDRSVSLGKTAIVRLPPCLAYAGEFVFHCPVSPSR
ncbi:hypothetical protein CF326_g5366 [Tilletia indica]|nr:hypothetical protein CF326_g5366 [Tilletia indica]